MTSEQIKMRISDALESELAKIYEEQGIESGDIPPWDFLKWEEVTASAAELFQRLIEWNK